jgi:hypothetical protein
MSRLEILSQMINMPAAEVVVKPSVWRFVFFRLPLFMGIAILAYLGVGFVLTGNSLLSSSLFFFAFIGPPLWVLAMYTPVFFRSTIIISEHAITGHAGGIGWKRCCISFEQIDPIISHQQSRIQRLLGSHLIRATDGSRIYVDGLSFERKQTEHLLAILDQRRGSSIHQG